MKKAFYILIILLSGWFSGYSGNRDSLDFRNVDIKTYNFYLESKWDSLIDLGNQAIKQNIDYYYLRVRLGIAYSEKKNYLTAASHFEKAAAFNSSDEFLLQQLINTYNAINQNPDESKLLKHFPESKLQSNQVGTPKFISGINVEGGYLVSNNFAQNEKEDLDRDLNHHRVTYLIGNELYFHAGLKHNIGYFAKIYHGFSQFAIDSKVTYTHNNQSFDATTTIMQSEYYIGGEIPLKNHWSLKPAVHIIWDNYTKYDPVPLNFPSPLFRWVVTTESYTSYCTYLSVNKEYKKIRAGAFGSYSLLFDEKIYTSGGSFTIFPKGNLDLYSTTVLTGVMRQDSSPVLVIDELIGIKITNKTWLELGYTYGSMATYNENNGFVVYNIPDNINMRWKANIIRTLTPKIQLTIFHTGFIKENEYFYIINSEKVRAYKSVNYINHSIIGGLTWNF